MQYIMSCIELRNKIILKNYDTYHGQGMIDLLRLGKLIGELCYFEDDSEKSHIANDIFNFLTNLNDEDIHNDFKLKYKITDLQLKEVGLNSETKYYGGVKFNDENKKKAPLPDLTISLNKALKSKEERLKQLNELLFDVTDKNFSHQQLFNEQQKIINEIRVLQNKGLELSNNSKKLLEESISIASDSKRLREEYLKVEEDEKKTREEELKLKEVELKRAEELKLEEEEIEKLKEELKLEEEEIEKIKEREKKTNDEIKDIEEEIKEEEIKKIKEEEIKIGDEINLIEEKEELRRIAEEADNIRREREERGEVITEYEITESETSSEDDSSEGEITQYDIGNVESYIQKSDQKKAAEEIHHQEENVKTSSDGANTDVEEENKKTSDVTVEDLVGDSPLETTGKYTFDNETNTDVEKKKSAPYGIILFIFLVVIGVIFFITTVVLNLLIIYYFINFLYSMSYEYKINRGPFMWKRFTINTINPVYMFIYMKRHKFLPFI